MRNQFFNLGFAKLASVTLVLVLFLGVQAGNALAQESQENAPAAKQKTQKTQKPKAQKRKQKDQIPSPEQQVVIKEFIQEHHPELIELLDRLEVRRPAIYSRAMIDVAKAHKRLANIQESNSERYDAALELWKVRSRIHVASARVVIKDSPENRERLRELVARQIELRTANLEFEQRKAEQRIQKIQDQLVKFGVEGSSEREARIEKETKVALNRFRGLNKKGKRQNKKQENNPSPGDGSQ